MRRTFLHCGALLVSATAAWGQGSTGPSEAPDMTVDHIQATVSVFGYLTNQQFLFTDGPALVGRNLDFTLGLSQHTAGTWFLMIAPEAQPDGPFVSFFGGPPSQVLIGRGATVLGPLAHDGIQAELRLRIPQNPSFLGRTWAAQALVTGGFVDLSSAVGGVVGNHL